MGVRKVNVGLVTLRNAVYGIRDPNVPLPSGAMNPLCPCKMKQTK